MILSEQKEIKQQLKKSLSGLPMPRNDYEIVVPEQATDKSGKKGVNQDAETVEDASDKEKRLEEEQQALRKLSFFGLKLGNV